MPDWLKNHEQPGVTIYGEVADAAAFRRDHGVMLVPLLAGSGMRIKIIEGLAEGLPMIATPIGAEGVAVTQGLNILLAETPQIFADAILQLAEDDARCAEIGKNAATLAAKAYQNRHLISGLLDFYTRTWQQD